MRPLSLLQTVVSVICKIVDLNQAEGYADLGLWSEAWEATKAIPSSQRGILRAYRVRLRASAPLGAWNVGEQLSELFRYGGESDRRLAAEFYLAYARHDPRRAAIWISQAMATWSGIRSQILKDSNLSALVETQR